MLQKLKGGAIAHGLGHLEVTCFLGVDCKNFVSFTF